MNEQVKKIYDFVSQLEDLYYSKVTCGENLQADLMNTAQASSFQRVRNFIEDMNDYPTEKGETKRQIQTAKTMIEKMVSCYDKTEKGGKQE